MLLYRILITLLAPWLAGLLLWRLIRGRETIADLSQRLGGGENFAAGNALTQSLEDHDGVVIPDIRCHAGERGGMVPGNIGGGGIGAIAGIVLLVLVVTLCAYIVKPGEQAVIQRLGAWERTKVDEGLSFKLPWPIETVTKADNTTLLPDGSLVLVVVDRSRDGFGGVLADLGLRVGDRLDTHVGDADNVIVGFNVVDDIGFPGAVAAALGRAQFEVDSEQSGINQGDPFGILVFDGLTGSDRVITDPTIHYGFATSADWVVPAAGSKMQFGSAAAPGEYPMLSTLSASVQVVAIPEPEVPLLGAMAAMAILMRRRRTSGQRGEKE